MARPFRFEMAWETHEAFSDFLQHCWKKYGNLNETLEGFQSALKEWNKDVFGNVFKHKRHLLARLGGVQRALETRLNPFLYNLEKTLTAEYNAVLEQEELIWFQKSRSNWVQLGDRNTRFFHTTTLIRRNRNKILTLKDSAGAWVSDPDLVKQLVLSHFH